MTSQSQITLPKNILHCPHSLKNLYHQSKNLKEGIGLNMSYVAFILLIFLISRFILLLLPSVQFSHSVMFDSVTPWTAACQASLSITSSWSLLKLMSIELVMSSNHLIPCHPFFSHLQSFPVSGSFQMSQLFESGGQSISVSASTSALPMNTQD